MGRSEWPWAPLKQSTLEVENACCHDIRAQGYDHNGVAKHHYSVGIFTLHCNSPHFLPELCKKQCVKTRAAIPNTCCVHQLNDPKCRSTGQANIHAVIVLHMTDATQNSGFAHLCTSRLIIAAPKCNMLAVTDPLSVIGMQARTGELMGMTKSSMAAMAPLCLS